MIPHTPSCEPADSKAKQQRRHGRLRCEYLRCPMGRVVNLSASGMRVHGRGKLAVKPDQVFFVVLQSLCGETKVKSRVAWAEQVDAKHFSVGIEFVDVSPSMRTELIDIARVSAESYVIAHRDEERKL
ncbi:MAG: hypothetical protein GC162_12170 [Planctomycetes bacterium]|nr:hypothetical protein [Planctomycetota bacterium]